MMQQQIKAARVPTDPEDIPQVLPRTREHARGALERIAQHLRHLYQAVETEPLPARIQDLLDSLTVHEQMAPRERTK